MTGEVTLIKKPTRLGNSRGFIIDQKHLKLDLDEEYVIVIMNVNEVR